MEQYNSQARTPKEMVDELMEALEQSTEKEVFTVRILDNTEDGLETLIVFKDESVMIAMINFEEVGNHLRLRTRGNYI